MYCSKCGVENSDGSTHCSNCGSVLGDIPQQPGTQPPAAMAVEPKTCGLAIAAFVMGLLSMTCILWPFLVLPAIICGIVGLVKISKSNGQLKGTGFAVAGLVIPAVLTIILPLFLAIMMPALSRAKTVAQRVVCATNLKGLSTAMIVYLNDYDNTFPSESWCDLLIEEADVSPKSFICPGSDALEGESSYAMNKHIAGMKRSNLPADVVQFFETDMGLESKLRNSPIRDRRHYEFLSKRLKYHNLNSQRYYDENSLVYEYRFNQFGGPDDLVLRHDEHGRSGCNIAFADGHTEFVTEGRIADLQWTAE